MIEKWKRNWILRKIDKLMDLTDIQLGRKVRKYFLHLNDKNFIIRNTLRISIDFLIILVPILIGVWKFLINPSGSLSYRIFGFALISSLPSLIFGIVEYAISTTMFYHLVIRRGPIGSIMDSIVDWSDKCSVDYHGYYYVSFSNLMSECLDPDGVDNINDWSDEELGGFMNLILGCLVIHIKADGNPNEEQFIDKFLDDTHAKSTMKKITNKVIARKEKRKEIEKNRLSGVAESMKDRIVQDEPDDSPEFRKIRDLKERLDEKAENLRMAATSKIGPAS